MKRSLWMLEPVWARIKLFGFIHRLPIMKRKDDSEGIRPQRTEPTIMKNISWRVDLSPTHETGNMYLTRILNFYRLMTFPSLFNGSFYCS